MKNSMKKLLALAMALTMLVGMLAACGDSNAPEVNGGTVVAPTAPPPEDPQEYMLYLSEKGVKSLTGSMGSVTGMMGNYNGSKAQAHLILSQTLIDTIEMATGDANIDLSFLKDISLDMSMAMDGNMRMGKIGIGLGNTGIASVNMMVDQSNMDIYMGIPELSDQYVKIPGSVFTESMPQDVDMTAAMEMSQKLTAAMPTEEELANLLIKYIDLFLNQIGNVQKTTETVTVGGVSQELTVLSVNITEQDALNGVKAVLTALKSDAEVEKILGRLDAVLAEIAQTSGESYDEDLLTQLSSGIDEFMAELETVVPSDDSGVLSLKMYADGNHDMVGLDITLPTEQTAVFHCISVNDGSNYAFLAEIETVQIIGSGTVSNRKFVLTESGDEYLILEARNYDASKNQNGNVSLDLLLTPGQALLDEMDLDLAAMGGNVALGLVLEANGNQMKIAYDVLVDGESLAKLELKGEPMNADVSVPQNVVDGTDQNAVMTWASGLNFNKLMENLKAAGISENLLNELMSEIFF